MSKKSERAQNKKIQNIIVWISAAFIAPIVVGLVLNYFLDRNNDKKTIRHLWNTLYEANEIKDPENKGPDSDPLRSIQIISDIEKERHPLLWEKHVKGTENNFEQFLSKVDVVVKISHRFTYELIALREESAKVVAKAEVDKSWATSELPLDLLGLVHEAASSRNENESEPFLPFAMIEGWSFQSKGKFTGSKFPTLDLSDPKTRLALSKIAAEKNSNELTAIAKLENGLLVPTFSAALDMQSCFKYEVGLVEVDTSSERCKPLVQRYIVSAKANAEFSKKVSSVCKSDLIKLSDSSVNFDPCAEVGILSANILCKDSVSAYVRKMTKDPKRNELIHKKYILENCQDEIKIMPKQYQYLFE